MRFEDESQVEREVRTAPLDVCRDEQLVQLGVSNLFNGVTDSGNLNQYAGKTKRH